jgi:hypothetical protein
MTLTFDFLLWAEPPSSWGIWVRAPYTKMKENYCQAKKIKIWSWAPQRVDIKTNWPPDWQSQYYLNFRHCTANYRPVLSSERAPYMKKEERNCLTKKIKIWSWASQRASTPKRTVWQTVGSNITWTWTFTISTLIAGTEISKTLNLVQHDTADILKRLYHILILSFHLGLGLPIGTFLLDFPEKYSVNSFSLPSLCLLLWTNVCVEMGRLGRHSLFNVLQPHKSLLCLLGPDILLGTLLRNTLSLMFVMPHAII